MTVEAELRESIEEFLDILLALGKKIALYRPEPGDLAAAKKQVEKLQEWRLGLTTAMKMYPTATLANTAEQVELALALLETEIAWLEDDIRRIRDLRAQEPSPPPVAAPAPAAAEDRLCSRCRKRDRHFDDLCKRCANDLGVRPTGKVA